MANLFTASEVVQAAIQIERNGEVFYDTLASSARDAGARELYTYLSGEEGKHAEVFQKMLEAVGEYRPQESFPGEYEAYMRALAESRVFTDDKVARDMASHAASPAEAIRIAQGAEKDSILFYYEMRALVPEREHGTLNRLIDEEKSHLRRLTELAKSL